MVHLLILVSLLFSFSADAAVAPSGVPQIGYGKDYNSVGAPAITVSDPTKVYSAMCGYGSSNVTAGNYYRCYKLGGSGTVSWTVAADKTAHCHGYEYFTNTGASTMQVNFGYGTAQVTNNNNSAPTGDVSYAPTGVSDVLRSASTDNVWFYRARPVRFSGSAAGAIIYPYIQAQNSSLVLNITFFCQDL